MKKFLMVLAFSISLIFSSNFIYAAEVQIYDYSVENIISNLKKECAQRGIDIWGTEYYTYKETQRCEVHFGNDKSNIIRFRLNNDKSVSRILVTIPNPFITNDGSENSFMQTATVTGIICKSIGLSESEAYDLANQWRVNFKNWANQNPNANYFHEKYSVWCSKTSRRIVEDVEMDDFKFDWYFYAYI